MGWKTAKYITRLEAMYLVGVKISSLDNDKLGNLVNYLIDELGEYDFYNYIVDESKEEVENAESCIEE